MAIDETRRRSTPSAFGQLLKRLRTAAALTQEEVAERAGVSARLISDLERGAIKRPRRDTIRMLADGLGLTDADRDTFAAVARGRHGAPAVPPRQSNLPLPPTPIVGRLHEAAMATNLLLRPDAQLLTLTGPGGVGKTRLALEVASHAIAADAFPGGACFVDLSPLRDPALVLSAIAQSVGVRTSGEQSLFECVVGALADARVLLVVDNCEHLIESAPVIADLLAACPTLTLLATSRTALHIRAEREYLVAPLSLPDLHRLPSTEELARIPAVELLLRRAEAATLRFALTAGNARAVAEIAIRLDGLPLAIELAAAWLKVLSPSDLLTRLERRLPLLTGGARDLPARQQAMRATIAWSYDLLSADEQYVFRQLALFRSGFTLEAAEAVAASSVLDGIAALVDKNLVRRIETNQIESRFGMLETIREYGLERLAAAAEEAGLRRRHAAWCVDLAERAEPELTGSDQQAWFARLDAEHDNLRTALAWTIDQRDSATALRLGAALYRYWATAGHYDEGRRWLEQALAMSDGEPSNARANALLGVGVMAYFRGDYRQAQAVWEDALRTFRFVENITGIASSFGNLGLVADAQADYNRAASLYEQALALFRELGDQTHVGFMLNNLGLIAYLQGKLERAETLHEEALAVARALGTLDSVAYSLGNLGLVALVQGDYAKAATLQTEALALRRDLMNKSGLARSLENIALIAAATRDSARAAHLFGAAESLRAEIGSQLPPNDREFNERYIVQARARLGSDAFAAAWEAGRALSLDEAIAYGLDAESSPA